MRIKDKLYALHLLMILIGLHLLGGCSGLYKHNLIEALPINDPSELSQEIKNELIYLSKNTRDETIITVKSLDLRTNKTYELGIKSYSVDVSPNMRFATYVRGEDVNKEFHHGLWLYDLEEKSETKVAGWDVDISEIVLWGPGFSSSGKQIIFSVTWLGQGNTGLAVVDKDGSNLKILSTSIPLNEGPEYSPDGSLIIVTCAGMDALSGDPGFQLCLLGKDGQQLRPLTNRGHGHGSYYFTPDGKKIVFSEFEHGGFFGIINKPEDRFYIMDIDGENKTLLLDWEVGVRGFSDDGKEIIFKGRRDEKSPWGIYIINIDGTNLRHLTYFDEFLEEWYADIEQY